MNRPLHRAPEYPAGSGSAGAAGPLAHPGASAAETLVPPLDFLRLIWGTLFGLAAFGERPDAWTWLGGALIFGSATWLTLKERR